MLGNRIYPIQNQIHNNILIIPSIKADPKNFSLGTIEEIPNRQMIVNIGKIIV
jgi:hypothetical protein